MKLQKEEELKRGLAQVKVNQINVEQREINCALYEKDIIDEKRRLEEVKKSLDEEKRDIELQIKDLQGRQEKVAQNEQSIILMKNDQKYEIINQEAEH